MLPLASDGSQRPKGNRAGPLSGTDFGKGFVFNLIARKSIGTKDVRSKHVGLWHFHFLEKFSFPKISVDFSHRKRRLFPLHCLFPNALFLLSCCSTERKSREEKGSRCWKLKQNELHSMHLAE